MWSREEALSSILSVELVELPVSQIMAKMEDEFGANDGQKDVKFSVSSAGCRVVTIVCVVRLSFCTYSDW